jgi:hypothetical protein
MEAQTAEGLRTTIRKLRKARAEADALFASLEREHEVAVQRCKRVSQGVDTAALILGMFVSLAGLAADARKALALKGADLERHNRKVLKEFVTGKALNDGSLVGNALLQDVKEGKALLFGKAVFKAYGDMTSPSFWAGAYTDMAASRSFKWDPVKWASYAETVGQRGRERIHSLRARALRNLDAEIRRYEGLLRMLETSGGAVA